MLRWPAFEKVAAFLLGLCFAVLVFAIVINACTIIYAKVETYMYIIALILAMFTLLVAFHILDRQLQPQK